MTTGTQSPRRMRTGARFGLAVTAAALALTASACSSSGNGGSNDGGTGTTSSKSPILVGGMASLSSQLLSLPQSKAAYQAAIDDINAKGGLDGRPLQLDFCDTKYQSAQELDCVRKLISDKVVAILNPNISADTGKPEYAAAEAAGIPMIGGLGYVPPDLTSKVSFPAASGAPGLVYGAIANLIEHGAKHIAIFGDAQPTSEYFSGIAADAIKAAGMTPVRTVTGDVSADPSLQSAAAKTIAGGVDGIFLTGSPTHVVLSEPALRKQGYNGLIASISVNFPAPVLKQLGNASSQGLLLTGQEAFISDSDNPSIAKFKADMSKYAPRQTLDENSLGAWTGVQLFYAVASRAKATTSAAVLNAFTNLKDPVDIGVIAPYKVVGAPKISDGTWPRMFNPTVQQGVVKNGVPELSGKGFINPFDALASARGSK